MSAYLTALAWLLLTFAVGVGLALVATRWERTRGLMPKREGALVADGAAGVLGFVGAAAAFLIGVLMLASIDHFNSTAEVANREAIAYEAAFDAATLLPQAGRDSVQRDLACLMRSVATNSWAASTRGDLAGDANSEAWVARLLGHIQQIEANGDAQENALGAVESELREANKFEQERLLAADSILPTALWVLLYMSLFVLVFVIVIMMRAAPALVGLSLLSVFLVSAGMIGVLVAFEKPFDTDTGVYISPRGLTTVMTRLEGTHPGSAWAPCERLAGSA